jgi:hypothetical protein
VKESIGVNNNIVTTTSTTNNKNNRKTSNADRIAPKPSSDVELAVRALVLKLLQAHANSDSDDAAQNFKELAALINRIRQHDSVSSEQVL